MRINKKIEKLFIESESDFKSECSEMFYQRETNTFEYFDIDNPYELIDACIINAYKAEFYLEYSYKFLNDYLRINNSLVILGAEQDDPLIKDSLEILKNIITKLKNVKTDIINFHIYLKNSNIYKPHKTGDVTMMQALKHQNVVSNPKTAEDIFSFLIKSLHRTEIALETLDYLIDMFFDKFFISDSEDQYAVLSENIKINYENLLDDYLVLKLNKIIYIKI